MKNFRRIVLITALSFAVQALHAQISNPDTMIHRVFATLKAKDEKAFVALYPNPQQFSSFIRNLLEQVFKSPEMKKAMEQDEKMKSLNIDSLINAQSSTMAAPEMVGKMQKQFAGVFQKTIEKGEKKGVNWQNATITGFTLDSTTEKDEGAPAAASVKTLKGVIDFTSDGKPYQLAYAKIIFLPTEGGWFGAEFPQLARKGESLAPDKEKNAEGESVPAETKKAPASKGKAPATKGGTKPPIQKSKT